MTTLKELEAEMPERVEEAPVRAVVGASQLKQPAAAAAAAVILTQAS